MTRADRYHHFDLMPAVHLDREFAGRSSDRHQMLSCDHNLALRDEDATDCPAVDNAGDPASQVSADHVVHDVSRQADNVRAQRFSVVHSHSGSPPHKVRSRSCSLSGSTHNKKFFYAHQYFVGCDPLFHIGTMTGNSISVEASLDGTAATPSTTRQLSVAADKFWRVS